jgi:hypothetical protein
MFSAILLMVSKKAAWDVQPATQVVFSSGVGGL